MRPPWNTHVYSQVGIAQFVLRFRGKIASTKHQTTNALVTQFARQAIQETADHRPTQVVWVWRIRLTAGASPNRQTSRTAFVSSLKWFIGPLSLEAGLEDDLSLLVFLIVLKTDEEYQVVENSGSPRIVCVSL